MEVLNSTATEMLERYGEDPPPFDLLFFEAREWLMEQGVDAAGVRIDLSGGIAGGPVGANGTLDFVWNFNTGEIDMFGSIGGQLVTLGPGTVSAGFLLIWNLPDNGGYEGESIGFAATYSPEGVGIDFGLEFDLEPYKGEVPTTLYMAPAGGIEVTGVFTGSYTRHILNIREALNAAY